MNLPRGGDAPPASPQAWLRDVLASGAVTLPDSSHSLTLRKLDLACSLGILLHMGHRPPGGVRAMLEWLETATEADLEELSDER